MEIKISEIREHFEADDAAPMTLWGVCLERRSATKRINRNEKPILLTLTKKDNISRYEYTTFKIRDSSDKAIRYSGNAYGTELRFFTTEQEAINLYNENLGKIIDKINTTLIGLEKEKVKMEALRLGR